MRHQSAAAGQKQSLALRIARLGDDKAEIRVPLGDKRDALMTLDEFQKLGRIAFTKPAPASGDVTPPEDWTANTGVITYEIAKRDKSFSFGIELKEFTTAPNAGDVRLELALSIAGAKSMLYYADLKKSATSPKIVRSLPIVTAKSTATM